MQIISGSIDCTKITKSKLVQGKFLNVTIILNDEPDKFGNHVAIAEGQTKEEREAKQPRTYLGNGKIVYDSTTAKKEVQKNVEPQNLVNPNFSENNLPF